MYLQSNLLPSWPTTLYVLLVNRYTHNHHHQIRPGGLLLIVRRRGFAPGEFEALLADPPGEEISAATKQRINAARPGLALLPYYYFHLLNLDYLIIPFNST